MPTEGNSLPPYQTAAEAIAVLNQVRICPGPPGAGVGRVREATGWFTSRSFFRFAGSPTICVSDSILNTATEKLKFQVRKLELRE